MAASVLKVIGMGPISINHDDARGFRLQGELALVYVNDKGISSILNFKAPGLFLCNFLSLYLLWHRNIASILNPVNIEQLLHMLYRNQCLRFKNHSLLL